MLELGKLLPVQLEVVADTEVVQVVVGTGAEPAAADIEAEQVVVDTGVELVAADTEVVLCNKVEQLEENTKAACKLHRLAEQYMSDKPVPDTSDNLYTTESGNNFDMDYIRTCC